MCNMQGTGTLARTTDLQGEEVVHFLVLKDNQQVCNMQGKGTLARTTDLPGEEITQLLILERQHTGAAILYHHADGVHSDQQHQ